MKNNDSKLFYDFINANGFNPENYYQILELVQSVPNSMSQYLREYKQFLLSRKVTYSELEEYDIKGALGYLEADATITVPKTLEADDYFRYHRPKLPYTPHGYMYPDISEFDTGVVFMDEFSRNEVSQIIRLSCAKNFPNMFIGFVADKNDRELSVKEHSLQRLSDTFYYNIVHDTDSEKGKEFYLMKRKNKKLKV